MFQRSALFLALASVFCNVAFAEYNAATHTQDVWLSSTAGEIAAGQNIAAQIAKEMKISKDPKDNQRVREIGAKIIQQSQRKELNYYFYVIDDKEEKNAFSLPGGYVYIYKGLLDILDDDELAYVIGHEAGHIAAKHALKQINGSLGATAVLLAAIITVRNSDAVAGMDLALSQIMSGYSQEDEFQADELAVGYTKAAGYKPDAGIRVMEKLYQEEKKNITPIDYFRSHPYTAQRIRHIREVLRLPITVEDYMNK